MNIIITAPSLDTNINVSGVSSVTNFVIENNSAHNYTHFKLGKSDIDKRGFFLFFRILKAGFPGAMQWSLEEMYLYMSIF